MSPLMFRTLKKGGQQTHARVAELVDALVLGTSAERRESSSLSFRTINTKWCFNKINREVQHGSIC